jgi:UDP-N-acetylmuramate--alanine ligase
MAEATPWSGRRLHFVAIGGAGMSGLALVARELGASVTGSDRASSSYFERVRESGVDAVIGHAAANVPEGEDVEIVYSTAIPEDNPERVAGRERGLRELHRAELLGEVSSLRRCLAVTGTHGKTTTSAMLVHILAACGLDPSYLVGGELSCTSSNAGWGEGEWIVVEADESDRSLLQLHPEVAVLTNLELDHHATYGSRLELEATMREFLARARRAVVWNRPELLALREDSIPFDVPGPRLEPAGSWFEWADQEVWLPVPGEHNALDAAAALEASRLAGVEEGDAAAALTDFQPVGRRLERVGETPAGATVYDDYAHHPTEVAATIDAARTLGPGRVLAAFQPHLYSRTAALWREFGAALALADEVVVLEIYPAREDAADWPGVSGRLVAAAAADAAGGRTVAWLPGFDAAERFLRGEAGEGDLVLTLGAGDVNELARRLVAPAA